MAESAGAVALPAPYKPRQEEICPSCKGRGYLQADVPYGHPDFGKAKACQCMVMHRSTRLFGDAHIP
ncbi:MAG TPA: hypothetical protein VGN34_08630 [Ktedonobacteraceae bacterium]